MAALTRGRVVTPNLDHSEDQIVRRLPLPRRANQPEKYREKLNLLHDYADGAIAIGNDDMYARFHTYFEYAERFVSKESHEALLKQIESYEPWKILDSRHKKFVAIHILKTILDTTAFVESHLRHWTLMARLYKSHSLCSFERNTGDFKVKSDPRKSNSIYYMVLLPGLMLRPGFFFVGSAIYSADFTGACFENVNFSSTAIDQVVLNGANLQGATFSPEMIGDVTLDINTKLSAQQAFDLVKPGFVKVVDWPSAGSFQYTVNREQRRAFLQLNMNVLAQYLPAQGMTKASFLLRCLQEIGEKRAPAKVSDSVWLRARKESALLAISTIVPMIEKNSDLRKLTQLLEGKSYRFLREERSWWRRIFGFRFGKTNTYKQVLHIIKEQACKNLNNNENVFPKEELHDIVKILSTHTHRGPHFFKTRSAKRVLPNISEFGNDCLYNSPRRGVF